MFKTKNRISVMMMVFILCLGCVTGCGNGSNTKNKKYSIVCTTFPQYDWVMNVLGEKRDHFDVTLLLDNGVDLHSYQPTAEDMIAIENCDLLIHVGGESDTWVEEVLQESTNKDMQVINMVNTLGERVKQEEVVEGMEHHHEHEDEAITKADIKDRTLAEFAGEWQSMHPLLLDGTLDTFCKHKANEDEDSSTTQETMFEKYKTLWACDAEKIKIDDHSITFTYGDGSVETAPYDYAGYSIKYAEDGSISNVRYQFETASENAPQYVQFNDHGHEPTEVEHFHIYFGNDSFESLMNSTTNPYFMNVGLTNEEILEGLTGHSHSHEHEADEHVWLSLKNAELLIENITTAIKNIDSQNDSTYQTNSERYVQNLNALDTQYEEMISKASQNTVLFGDRFPFRYLVDDYDLDYYAAFSGCSAETEASFETVVFLAQKLDELKLNTVLVIESSDQKLAQTIIDTTSKKDQKILVMDSMQSVTKEEIESGLTYLSIMQENLETLTEALK